MTSQINLNNFLFFFDILNFEVFHEINILKYLKCYHFLAVNRYL